MISPLIAGMPAKGWLSLLLLFVFIAGVGAFLLRKLRKKRLQYPKRKRGIPLSLIAIIAGPIFGVVIAIAEGLANRTEEFPNGQWDYSKGIIVGSTIVGVFVAVVFALVVDISSYPTPTDKSEEP